MDNLTILITGVGAPGFPGTLYSLREGLPDISLRIVGTDANPDNPGRHLCDRFSTVPNAKQSGYLDEITSLCQAEKVDLLVPQNTMELEKLAEAAERMRRKGTVVMVSPPQAIRVANSKSALMRVASSCPGAVAKWAAVHDQRELLDSARALGWPEKLLVVKPAVSHGRRGFRVIDETKQAKNAFLEEKDPGMRVSMEQLRGMLDETFPELVLMEHLPGMEYSVDCYRGPGGQVIVPRRRDAIRGGISFTTTACAHEEIIRMSQDLAERLDLRYAFGFQFKEDEEGRAKILECNPRVQGTMIAATAAGANVIGMAAREAVGLAPVLRAEVAWGRTLHRYWGAIWDDNGAVRRV